MLGVKATTAKVLTDFHKNVDCASPETTPLTNTTQESVGSLLSGCSPIILNREGSFASDFSDISHGTNYSELGRGDVVSETLHGPEVIEAAEMSVAGDESA
jgi:hypothetical protein